MSYIDVYIRMYIPIDLYTVYVYANTYTYNRYQSISTYRFLLSRISRYLEDREDIE